MSRQAGILIIDAEDESRITMEQALEGLGRELFVTNSGIDALEQLADHSMALVLVALELPDIDGLAVLKKIERERPEVGVIVVASGRRPNEIEEAVRHGALDVLQRPVSAQRVRSAVRSALRRKDGGGLPTD